MQQTELKTQYQTVKEKAGLFDISSWGVISIAGPDRNTFLHGMVSNEVNKLAVGESNYSLLLTAKGKIIADVWVYVRESDIVLITRAALREAVIQTLDKYLIMEDAEIHDASQEFSVLAVQGREAESMLNQPGCMTIPASLTGDPGGLLVVPESEREAVLRAVQAAGAKMVSNDLLEAMRIEAGIPIVGRELDDTVIPQEAGLHHAISFEKGCYIGQEVVARLHFRGHVNRELTRFVLQCEEPFDSVAMIHHDGKEVGKITSACRSLESDQIVGLGYLRSALRKDGEQSTAKLDDNEFGVVVKM